MANSVRIGGARVDLTGQDAEFQAVMKRAGTAFRKQEQHLKSLRKRVSQVNKGFTTLRASIASAAGGLVAGALGGAALTTAAKQAADFSTKLVEGARNTGLLATELEAIAAIFEQDGIGFGATTTALATFQKRIAEVGDGLATYTRSFEKLGLSLEDLKDKSPREQFILLAEAIAQTEDQSIRQQAAQDLLGRAGKQLVGTILQMKGAWRESIDAADDATRATNTQYESLKDMTGAFVELKRQMDDLNVRTIVEHKETILAAANAWQTLKVKALEYFAAVAEAATPQMGEGGIRELQEQYNAAVRQATRFREQWDSLFERGLGGTQLATDTAVLLRRWSDEAARLARALADARQAAGGGAAPTTTGGGAPGGGGGAAPAGRPEPAPVPEGLTESWVRFWSEQQQIATEANAELTRIEQERLDRMADGRETEAESWRRFYAEQVQIASEAANEAARIEGDRLAKLAADQEAAWSAVKDAIKVGLVDSLAAAVQGGKDLSETFKNVARSILDAVTQAIILKTLTAAAGGGGPIGGFLSFLGFGGSNARGGPVSPGSWYMVGERGPEAFVPSTPGTIVPNGGLGGGVTVNVGNLVGTIDSTDGPGVRQALAEALPTISAAIQSQVEQSLSRPGQARSAVFGR